MFSNTMKYKFFIIFKWILALLVTFIIVFPLWWIFVYSITLPGELFSRSIKYWPENPTLASYKYLINNVNLFRKIWDTFIIVGFSILIGMVVSIAAAFSFARFKS